MPVLASKTEKLDTQTAGRFRAHVCLSCGFTEWYAIDLPALIALAANARTAQVIEASVPAPYR